MSEKPFCDQAIEGWLTGAERGALTGWTHRVTAVLAHLADAWCIADEENAPAAVAALAMLIKRSRSESQRQTWRSFVVACAGGQAVDGGRGSELLAAIDEWTEHWSGWFRFLPYESHGARRG